MKMICPCESGRTYDECCKPYLSGLNLPKTPEALMRSRYTAYSQANIDYIQQTMRGPALINFNPQAAYQWAVQAKWLGLKVVSAPTPSAQAKIGFVEFIASFLEQNQRKIIHERSEFHFLEGRWFYVTGNTPKVNLNASCPCGSGKKFKRCCHA